ncbi:MAG: flagellar export chaperone FliS [bacterium]|nr:flagellar export chaperone FliS [bacterium]
MYAANTLSRRYTQAQVASVDRHRLLLLVFEGGLTFLGRARSALDAGDMQRFGEAISKSQAVIAELLGTLDHQQGGSIAKELARLYEFMQHHLTEANALRSVQHVDEVERVLGIIAGAYREILERPAVAAGSPAA